MVAEILIVAVVAGGIWWWRSSPRQARHAAGPRSVVPLLTYDDLPPVGAFDPVPDEQHLDAYVESGISRLEGFLAGRDTIA